MSKKKKVCTTHLNTFRLFYFVLEEHTLNVVPVELGLKKKKNKIMCSICTCVCIYSFVDSTPDLFDFGVSVLQSTGNGVRR